MRRPAVRRGASLALGATFFVLLFWVWPREFRRLNEAWGWPRLDHPLADAAGLLLAAGGGCLFAWCVAMLVRDGRGTPVPTDPPRSLVAGGPYALSRNPIYVAYFSVLVGEALILGDAALFLYAAIVAAAAHLMVVLMEEPVLRRRFGAAFQDYRRRVPRWL